MALTKIDLVCTLRICRDPEIQAGIVDPGLVRGGAVRGKACLTRREGPVGQFPMIAADGRRQLNLA